MQFLNSDTLMYKHPSGLRAWVQLVISPTTCPALKMEEVPWLQELWIQPTQREKITNHKNWQRGAVLVQGTHADSRDCIVILKWSRESSREQGQPRLYS